MNNKGPHKHKPFAAGLVSLPKTGYSTPELMRIMKHKIKLINSIVLLGLVVPALFSGSASALTPATCYEHATSTKIDCALVKQNDNANFNPVAPNCYDVQERPSGAIITHVDCATQAKLPAAPTPQPNTVSEPGSVDLGDPTGQYSCGSGDSRVNTTINFGCKGKGNGTLDLIFAIIRFLSAGVGIIVIGSLVFAGIQYTASRGDPNASAAAIKRIQNTAIALLIYIFAFAILNYLVPAGFLK